MAHQVSFSSRRSWKLNSKYIYSVWDAQSLLDYYINNIAFSVSSNICVIYREAQKNSNNISAINIKMSQNLHLPHNNSLKWLKYTSFPYNLNENNINNLLWGVIISFKKVYNKNSKFHHFRFRYGLRFGSNTQKIYKRMAIWFFIRTWRTLENCTK